MDNSISKVEEDNDASKEVNEPKMDTTLEALADSSDEEEEAIPAESKISKTLSD